MYEILTILGLVYLLNRIAYYYKKVDYNKVKFFVSIVIFSLATLILKQLYDYEYITFDTYYFVSIVIGLIFYLLLMGSIVYKYKSTDNQKERKRLVKAFLLGSLPILIWGFIIFLIFWYKIVKLLYNPFKIFKQMKL